jgi:hypothetical protein
MKQSRRTTIVIETERLLVVRSQGGTLQRSSEQWCEHCGSLVTMIGLEMAAIVSATSEREIARRVEDGGLHFAESSQGVLLICLPSLWPEKNGDTTKGEWS